MEIAEAAGWQMLRQNVNTFARHGVFEVEGFTARLARRLSDPAAIRRAKVFPYQIMATWSAVSKTVPAAVSEALVTAMDVAIGNVPALAGRVVVCPDVSGSMSSPITGRRAGATTVMRASTSRR